MLFVTQFFCAVLLKRNLSANLRPKCVKNKYHGYVDIRPVKHSEDSIFNTLTSWYHSLWSIWTIGAKDWKYFAKLFDQRCPLQYALIKIWEIFLESFWIDFFSSLSAFLINLLKSTLIKILEISGSTLEDVKLNFNSNFYYFSNFQCAMMRKNTSAHQENKRKMGRCTQLLKFKSTFSSRKLYISKFWYIFVTQGQAYSDYGRKAFQRQLCFS